MGRASGALLLLPLLLLSANDPLRAQSPPVAETIRYHFGDNPQWADPHFDDSAWPVARQDRWPVPALDSDGFVWVRARVAIPKNASEPLEVRIGINGAHPAAAELFVNGRLVGAEGGFPPTGAPAYLPPSAVFDLPQGAVDPSSPAVVAFRAWYMPRSRPMSRGSHATTTFVEENGSNYRSSAVVTIGSAETIRAVDRVEHLSGLLGSVPDLALNALLGLVGLCLLVIWRWTRRAELAWCGALLIFNAIYEYFFVATDQGYLSVRYWEWGVLFVLFSLATMLVTVEFVRTVHGLRGRTWRWAAHGCWIVTNVGDLASLLAQHPSAGLHAVLVVTTWSVQIFSLIMIGANLWVLFVRRYNRAIAAAMATVSLAALAAHFGFRQHWILGHTDISLFDVASIASGFAVAAMLVRRAVAAWQQSKQLQAEFEAASELQQRLVSPAVSLPGFRIESAYKPATHVGGDFFYIRPDEVSGILVVVGDVSGKGLRAAMTVNSVMGALRTMPPLPPGRILGDLNRGLLGQMQGGFVTCCAARVAQDGKVTIANAGHLPPYMDGAEAPVMAGLPLGIAAPAQYDESSLQLREAGTLTFLSDGVVEARNKSGELFGFDRTRQISRYSAEAIAQAAQAFGQEDDITVLTLSRLPD
jgi:phosphoserine phosphatase RsbU/P